MLNELVLASSYRNTIKFLDTKLDNIKRNKSINSKSDNNNYGIQIDKLFNILNNIDIDSIKEENDSNSENNNSKIDTEEETNNSKFECLDKLVDAEEELDIQETKEDLDKNTTTNKQVHNTSYINNFKELKENNETLSKSNESSNVNSQEQEEQKNKKFSKQIPVRITWIPKLNSVNYYNRTPSTSWKSNILKKLYSIVKRINYSRLENNNKNDSDSIMHTKKLIMNSLKDMGINNLGIECINNRVVSFIEENGKLESNQVISERMLQKNLSQYKINKDDLENNMLIFLMIYLVKKLEDDMKKSNIYPSGFKKKHHLNLIISKFNNWNRSEFISSPKIQTGSIHKFIESIRKNNKGKELETIINLCLCKFTKLN